MRIKIHTNILNDLIDTPEIFVPDKITLKQLFEHLIQRYGEAVRDRIFEKDNLKSNIIVIVNGNSIDFSDESETKLDEDNSISIITAVAGG